MSSGSAPDAFVARDMIKALNPDVITLDVEMPRMDGLTFLRKIMTLRPMPVVMISTLTQAGAEVTLEALEAGAVDFVAKPTNSVGPAMAALADELRAKVKGAAKTRVRIRSAQPQGASAAAPGAQSTDQQDCADRRLHRRRRGLEDAAHGPAAGLSADAHHPAHAGDASPPLLPAASTANAR